MDQFEDRMFASSLHAFEAALAGHVQIPDPKPARVLLALDGSAQDAVARLLAQWVAARTGAQVVERADLATGRDVLAAAGEASGVGLIVLPAPFREEITLTRDASLGSGADIVLAEALVPVLLARRPVESVEPCFSDALIPITVATRETPHEVGWALALAAPEGRVEVLDVPDLTVIDEVKHLLGDTIDLGALREEALKRAAKRDTAAIGEAAKAAGAARGLQVEVNVHVGEAPMEAFAKATRGRTRFVVTARPGPVGSPEFHRAHDLALRSDGPILFV